MSILKLRPYQVACLKEVDAALASGVRRPAVVMATGSGKTVIFAHLSAHWEGERVLILVNRDELIRQTIDKLRGVAPDMHVGVIAGSQDERDAPITVASVQTLSRDKRLERFTDEGGVGLIIVDECHYSTARSYRKILDAFPEAVAVGFTATMSRADSAQLSEIWERVVFRLDILDMIEAGYLCDVVGRRVTVNGMTLDEVARSGGDFAPGSLSEVLMRSDAIEATVKAYREHAAEMSGVVFVPTVDAARAFEDAFNAAGIVASAVWGGMAKDERRQKIELFDRGRVQVLVNCMVLTTGWDSPRAQCAVIARPTLHPGLYVQMVGRVLRPFPGKDRALVLDVSGASELHRLATLADLTSRRLSDEVLASAEDGASLNEIVRREVERGNPALQQYAVSSYEVDLFKANGVLWLQTYEGIWFVSTADTLYFLWPGSEPGSYSVGRMPYKRTSQTQRGWAVRDVDFESAMAWAEQAACEDDDAAGGANLVRANASWRKGRAKATDGQKDYARRLGLSFDDDILKRDIADMLTVEIASRKLDRTIKRK